MGDRSTPRRLAIIRTSARIFARAHVGKAYQTGTRAASISSSLQYAYPGVGAVLFRAARRSGEEDMGGFASEFL